MDRMATSALVVTSLLWRRNVLQMTMKGRLSVVMWRDNSWRTPKSRVEPTWGSNYVELQKSETWGVLPISNTKEG
jgi:hypothetical protein